MKDKSHKGQKHKGCSWCAPEKQLGNGAERRPPRDRRWLEGANHSADSLEATRLGLTFRTGVRFW